MHRFDIYSNEDKFTKYIGKMSSCRRVCRCWHITVVQREFLRKMTKKLDLAVRISTCNREVSGSNFCRDTDCYPDYGFRRSLQSNAKVLN
jgi:hypothetical protein